MTWLRKINFVGILILNKLLNMINWLFFPKSRKIPKHLEDIINTAFIPNASKISSNDHTYHSNEVMSILQYDIEKLGYMVETNKSAE